MLMIQIMNRATTRILVMSLTNDKQIRKAESPCDKSMWCPTMANEIGKPVTVIRDDNEGESPLVFTVIIRDQQAMIMLFLRGSIFSLPYPNNVPSRFSNEAVKFIRLLQPAYQSVSVPVFVAIHYFLEKQSVRAILANKQMRHAFHSVWQSILEQWIHIQNNGPRRNVSFEHCGGPA